MIGKGQSCFLWVKNLIQVTFTLILFCGDDTCFCNSQAEWKIFLNLKHGIMSLGVAPGK